MNPSSLIVSKADSFKEIATMSAYTELTKAAPPVTRHTVYGSFAEVEHLQKAWNDLARRVGDMFASYDWCQTWWQHFGHKRRLEIHTLHDGDRLVAVLPVFREVLLVSCVCLHVVRLLACDYASDAAGLAIEPQYADSFLNAVLASLTSRGHWDILHLGPLRSYCTVTEQICATCAASTLVQAVIRGRQDNWATLFDLAPNFDGYMQSLPRRDRHDTLRRERRLREAHDVSICLAQTPQEVRDGMEAVIRLHQTLCNGKGQPGHFGTWPSQAQFHRDIAQRMLANDQLLLLTLRADGQIVGAAYGYHFGPRTHSLMRGYCNQGPWRSFSLGRFLHCQVVHTAIQRGSNVLESGRGVFDYKLRLGGQLHGERSLTIVRRGWKSRLRFWAALRIAYLLHVAYARIWLDTVAPRLRLKPTLRHSYARLSFLAQLFRRARFHLFGQPSVQEACCPEPAPRDGGNDSESSQQPD